MAQTMAGRRIETMSNMLLPPEERDLTPDQVVRLDQRRFRGLMLQVMGGIFGIMATLLTVWAGQDFTYGPGWIHPMGYYMIFAGIMSIICITVGTALRRGTPEFD
jgi:hypothetical protein